MSDSKFSWNVFFKGPEGFKEHIQATAEDGVSLANARTAGIATLKEIGATPEPERTGYRGGNSRPPQTNPAIQGAVASGVAKVCPDHNVSMEYRPGGLSRTKFLPDGSPKPFSASYRCPEQGCNQIEWLGN